MRTRPNLLLDDLRRTWLLLCAEAPLPARLHVINENGRIIWHGLLRAFTCMLVAETRIGVLPCLEHGAHLVVLRVKTAADAALVDGVAGVLGGLARLR